MASTVSYLLLGILCTSIDAYVGHNIRCCFFVMTKDWRRGARRSSSSGDIESAIGANDDEISVSSAGGQNWRDIVDDEDEELDDDMNVAGIDSNMSGLNWRPTDETNEEDVTQTSSMLADTDLALHSGSLESTTDPVLTQSESDVLLNRNDSFREEKPVTAVVPAYTHSYPKKPDFLDMCCAGDPLQVERHLEYPVKLQKTKTGKL